jgi:hypothetical protein
MKAAKRNGWYKECTEHMESPIKPMNYWTLETCKEEALKYTTKREWQKNSGSSYTTSLQKGWYQECVSHMTGMKGNGYWTKERCLEEAKKYQTAGEWENASKGSNLAAIRKGWYKECIAHMTPKQKPAGYWTKERCLEEAKKYTTRSEFYKTSAYVTARKNGW